MATVISIEPGCWVVDYPTPIRHLCYEVRGIEGEYVRLRALHVISKQRFNCSSPMRELAVIRLKDGTRVEPALPLGVK